jgi:hypothetical protein
MSRREQRERDVIGAAIVAAVLIGGALLALLAG